MTKSSAAAPATENSPFAFASCFHEPMFDTLTRAGDVYTRTFQTWQAELMRFAQARFERDSELGHRLLGCKDWPEVIKLQQEWAASTAQDYFGQAQRLLEMASKVGGEVVSAQTPAGNASGRQAA